jgi:hypothetical protein
VTRRDSDSPRASQVDVFTFVATGIVFLDPDSSDIVWKNARRVERTIGREPWRNTDQPRPSELTGSPAWRQDRQLVGNPAYDLVTWVETGGERRGDLVVVRASTGDVLARTPVSASAARSVVIVSLDDEAVYFATPDPTTGFPDMPGADIWVWRWPTGDAPEAHGGDRYYSDVSAGLWARYGNGVIEFTDEGGPAATTTPDSGAWLTDFGRQLSPDGRYWYNAWEPQIVDTATGERVRLPVARNLAYGWTAASELTFTDPYTACSARSGSCRGPGTLHIQGVCAPFDVYCRNSLPVN